MPSIANFVRRASLPLLREFLHRRGIALSDDELAGETKEVAKAIEKAFADQPLGWRSQFDFDLEKVEALARDPGQRAVEQVTLSEVALQLPAGLNRALWLFLFDTDTMRHAEDVLYNDERRGSKQWTPFKLQEDLELRRTEPALQSFRARLQVHFDTTNVDLEIFERRRPETVPPKTVNENIELVDRVFQVTIYREGKPYDDLSFEGNKLKAGVRREVIEASVTYEPRTGRIECIAGDRASRVEIVKATAIELLGCDTQIDPVELRAFDLRPLRNPTTFATEPDDGIDSVRVTKMVLSPAETRLERLTLESRRNGPDIWSMIGRRLGRDALASAYTIDQAELCIRYRGREGKRLRALRISITHPSGSNIKEHTAFEHMISQKYLPKWGLASA